VDKPNTVSRRVLEKLGMRVEERLNRGNALLVYSLTSEDYKDQRSAGTEAV